MPAFPAPNFLNHPVVTRTVIEMLLANCGLKLGRVHIWHSDHRLESRFQLSMELGNVLISEVAPGLSPACAALKGGATFESGHHLELMSRALEEVDGRSQKKGASEWKPHKPSLSHSGHWGRARGAPQLFPRPAHGLPETCPGWSTRWGRSLRLVGLPNQTS